MAGLEIENSQGVVALDQQQWRDLRNGYGVAPSTALGTLNGECEVTINGTGDFGTGNSALSVGSGTVLFGGTTTSVSAQNVDIDAGQSNPRKDVVYIDTNGDAQVRKGSPASVPSDAPGNRFQTWKPAPYDMHDVDAVVLAEVWVPANASSIGSADVRDRRLRADLETRALATEELESTNNTFIRATLSANNSGTSAGTFKNIYDGESKDNRGEFNSSGQFVPDKTGEYEIIAGAEFAGSTASGDDVRARVQDVDAGNTVSTTEPTAKVSQLGRTTVFQFVENLTAGTTYEIQATNGDNSFGFHAAFTEGTIRWSPVQ